MTRLLWVLEDGATFTPAFDLYTTQALMRACERMPLVSQRITTVSRIFWADGVVKAACAPVRLERLAGPTPYFTATELLRIEDFDAVLLRVDPPITELYRHALILLSSVEERSEAPLFVNSPAAILVRGSKLVNLRFAECISDGLVSADAECLTETLDRAPPGTVFVVKPLDRSGGEGVMKISGGDPAAQTTLKRLSAQYGFLHLQLYLPDVEHVGEVRHLVFGGEIIAHWRKRPLQGDFRCNLDRGAVAEPMKGAPATVVQSLVSRLWKIEPGFVFLSADFIGERLNELNVENTGGLPTADELYRRDHAALVIERLQALSRRGPQILA